MIAGDGKWEIEINRRIGLTKYTFNRIEQGLKWKNTGQQLKVAGVKCCVLYTPLCCRRTDI